MYCHAGPSFVHALAMQDTLLDAPAIASAPTVAFTQEPLETPAGIKRLIVPKNAHIPIHQTVRNIFDPDVAKSIDWGQNQKDRDLNEMTGAKASAQPSTLNATASLGTPQDVGKNHGGADTAATAGLSSNSVKPPETGGLDKALVKPPETKPAGSTALDSGVNSMPLGPGGTTPGNEKDPGQVQELLAEARTSVCSYMCLWIWTCLCVYESACVLDFPGLVRKMVLMTGMTIRCLSFSDSFWGC